MLCKDKGLPIVKFLMKMREGHTSNGRKHLNEKHHERLKKIEAVEEAEKEVSGKTCRIVITQNIC